MSELASSYMMTAVCRSLLVPLRSNILLRNSAQLGLRPILTWKYQNDLGAFSNVNF